MVPNTAERGSGGEDDDGGGQEKGKRRGRRDIWCGILLMAQALYPVCQELLFTQSSNLTVPYTPSSNLMRTCSIWVLRPRSLPLLPWLILFQPHWPLLLLKPSRELSPCTSAPSFCPCIPTSIPIHPPAVSPTVLRGLGELSPPLHSQKLTQPGHLYLITTHNTLPLVTQLCNLLFLEKWVRV